MYKGIVYSHVNKVNKKEYIGQTVQPLSKRFGPKGREYIRQDTVFSSAIKKYGWGNFDHVILKEIVSEDIEDLKKLLIKEEMRFINERNTVSPNGYNLQMYDNRKQIHHEKTKEKIRKKRKTQIITEETKIKISVGNKGKRRTPEMIERYIKSKTGHSTSQETRDKISKTVGIYQKDNRWYNNGVINKRFKDGVNIPNGFVKGYLSSEKQKGLIYYNNGVINKRFKEGIDIPDGFVKGQIRKNGL